MNADQLCHQHYSVLYFFVLKRVKDDEAARDILQNVFLKILEHKSSLKDTSKLDRWAFQIARNEIADHYQKIKTFPAEESPIDSSLEEACCLGRFIEELPDIYREPLSMVYLHAIPQTKAAVLLNITLPAFKGRLRRAKELLKDRFQTCCKYRLNQYNQLVGPGDCHRCIP